MKKIFYHGACNDGFCAAWLWSRHLGTGEDDYVPLTNRSSAWDLDGQDIVFLDIAPDDIESVCQRAKSVLVIDHHVSREQELREAVNRFQNLDLRFDVTMSGAGLTEQYIEWRGYELPAPEARMARYVQDADLWTWFLWESRAINAYIKSYDHEFGIWDNIARSLYYDTSTVIHAGQAILRANERLIDRIYRNKILAADGSWTVNSPVFQSELGNRLAKEEGGNKMGVVWCENSDGTLNVSLRSVEGGPDVSVIAKANGGGGHVRAAGYGVTN